MQKCGCGSCPMFYMCCTCCTAQQPQQESPTQAIGGPRGCCCSREALLRPCRPRLDARRPHTRHPTSSSARPTMQAARGKAAQSLWQAYVAQRGHSMMTMPSSKSLWDVVNRQRLEPHACHFFV